MSYVGVSLSSFHYWYLTNHRVHQFNTWLEQQSDICDSFEVGLSFAEISDWSKELIKSKDTLPARYQKLSSEAQKNILSSRRISFHLDDMKRLEPGKEDWLVENLNVISELRGPSTFTTHPDEFELSR